MAGVTNIAVPKTSITLLEGINSLGNVRTQASQGRADSKPLAHSVQNLQEQIDDLLRRLKLTIGASNLMVCTFEFPGASSGTTPLPPVPPEKGGPILAWEASPDPAAPPTGADAVIDILRFPPGELAGISLFDPGSEVIIPDGTTDRFYGAIFKEPRPQMRVGDRLRGTVLTPAGAENLLVTLYWAATPGLSVAQKQ